MTPEERIEETANAYIRMMPTNDPLVLDKIRAHYFNGALQEANKSEKLVAAVQELLPTLKTAYGRSRKRAAAIDKVNSIIKRYF